MELSEIEKILKDALDLHEVHVKGEGSHFNIISTTFHLMNSFHMYSALLLYTFKKKMKKIRAMHLP